MWHLCSHSRYSRLASSIHLRYVLIEGDDHVQTIVAVLSPAQSMATILLAFFIFGTPPQWYQVIGAVVITGGLYVIISTEKRARMVILRKQTIGATEDAKLLPDGLVTANVAIESESIKYGTNDKV